MLSPACARQQITRSQEIVRTTCSAYRNIRRHNFHTTSAHRNEFPNHYETLNIPPNATDKEIKKQFYTLSKSYHPDLHPNDPNASKRFVRISEAYAVLSSTEKRKVYDRDFSRATAASAPAPASAYPSGSFSSASTPAGGRPASGLSRRRTKFQGPPPSFYQSGGWGEQGAKRAEHASRPSHAWEQAGDKTGGAAEGGATQGMPGVGPGGFAHGFENDVPHFDSKGHYQTHSTIEQTRHRARRKVRQAPSPAQESAGNGITTGFFGALAVLISALAISLGPAMYKSTPDASAEK